MPPIPEPQNAIDLLRTRDFYCLPLLLKMLSWDCNWVICINNGSTTYSIKNVALVGSEWGNNNKTIPNIAPGKSAVIAAEGSFNYPYTQMYGKSRLVY